jgi:hypothetical protein
MSLKNSLAILFLFPYFIINSQSDNSFIQKFEWQVEKVYTNPTSTNSIESAICNNCFIINTLPQLSAFDFDFEVNSDGEATFDIEILEEIDSPISINNSDQVGPKVNFDFHVADYRGQKRAKCTIYPFYKYGNQIKLITKANIKHKFTGTKQAASTKRNRNKTESILASGDIYKIKVTNSGVVKLSRSFFSNTLSLNTSNINPQNIKIFGARGGLVPEIIANERVDDLEELPVKFVGGNDANFDTDDHILFYAEGPNMYKYNAALEKYEYEQNIYDDGNYYYIKIDNTPSKRISNSLPISDVSNVTDVYDKIQRIEVDKTNLLGTNASTEGTGQKWFGDYYFTTKEYNYSTQFDFGDLVVTSPISVNMEMAVRSSNTSSVSLSIENQVFNQNVSSVNTTSAESIYARIARINQSVNVSSSKPTVKVKLNDNGNNEGWLDFIEIQSKNKLNLPSSSQLFFRNYESANNSSFAYNISNGSNKEIWDITNPFNIQYMSIADNKISFNTGNILHEFIAFDLNGGFVTPTYINKVGNQNLHAISKCDVLLIYPTEFKDATITLANHRASHNNLNVVTAQVDEVFNEFSSGKKDPSAIRDFAKMIYDRDRDFRYLILFGDGTYDYKGLYPDLPKNNFIPIYETKESLDPIDGFPSDDYFGLLSDSEGLESLKGDLDVSVGRLTVKTSQEANGVINKIINYDTSPNRFGDWRLRCAFISDDEDSNRHVDDSDFISNKSFLKNKNLNHKKIYLDAFIQETTPGGTRFPDVTEEINKSLFNGTLVMNYLGHGGPKGLAQERVLKVPDIQSWTNFDKLTLFITATCSFSGYDDPAVITAGEEVLLNPRGGAVALLTTTRAVYISENKKLTEAVFDTIFIKENNSPQRFGDIMLRAKNAYGSGNITNSRKFTLLGDPSQFLALPKDDIAVTEFNGKPMTELDTVRALDQVEFKGIIKDEIGNIKSDFNGIVQATVFDKALKLKTLGQDNTSSVKEYNEYKSIIFKGSATVTNGEFSFSFTVPKDINYAFGKGRISLYAYNGVSDAAGNSDEFYIGGSSKNAIVDEQGPNVDIFINDESFVYGGISNEEPILLLKLEDDFGINVTGNSIGHDLSASLNDDTQNTFILNEFYESEIDNPKKGTVRYPLSKLAAGRYSISAKAWDISNNSSEARTEFVIIDENTKNLSHVLNYPNPFTTNTNFWFEHDLVGSDIDVLINIYTVTGKVIKTLKTSISNANTRVTDLNWDGRDDFGNKLGKGVYLYKIKVGSENLGQYRESKFEKIVLL